MPATFSLIGTGFGSLHGQYLKALGLEADSIFFRSDRGAAERVACLLGSEAALQLRNLDELADCTSDVVVLSTYPRERVEMMRALDRRGRVLIVDKPVCGAGEFEELKTFLAVSLADVRVFFQWRYHPDLVALREWLRSREHVGVQIEFLHDFLAGEGTTFPWRHDPQTALGGASADLGIHCIDLARYLLGPVELISSKLTVGVPRRRTSNGASVRAMTDDAGAIVLSAGTSEVTISFSRVASSRVLRVSAPDLERYVNLDPTSWWVDPSELALNDWRIECYKDMLSPSPSIAPSRDEILNGQQILLSTLSGGTFDE